MSVVTDAAVSRFLSITHTTDVDEWRAMIERKSAINRYFRELDQAAKAPAKVQPKPKRKPQPKPPRDPKPRTRKPTPPKTTRPRIRPCPTCGRNTRPDSPTAATEYPNTQPRKSKGNCLSCYKKSRKKTNRTQGGPRIKPCAECGHPTRPPRSRIADYPGTKTRDTATLCQTCYRRARRNAA